MEDSEKAQNMCIALTLSVAQNQLSWRKFWEEQCEGSGPPAWMQKWVLGLPVCRLLCYGSNLSLPGWDRRLKETGVSSCPPSR